jgi:hypothetical protein
MNPYEDERFRIPPSSDHNDLKVYNDLYSVPRVTKLLDTIKEDYLLYWANKLGWQRKSYKQTLNEAAEIGSYVHEDIELYLKTGEIGLTAGFTSFLKWWNTLRALNNVTDVQSEIELIGPMYGGTTDLFFRANGVPILCDFKTSNNIGYKYVMQLAAYKKLMEERIHEPIMYCIILQVDKYEEEKFNVYTYDMHDPAVSEMFEVAQQYMDILAQGYLYNTWIQTKFNYTSKAALNNERLNKYDA